MALVGGPCPHCSGTQFYPYSPPRDVWVCAKCGRDVLVYALAAHDELPQPIFNPSTQEEPTMSTTIDPAIQPDIVAREVYDDVERRLNDTILDRDAERSRADQLATQVNRLSTTVLNLRANIGYISDGLIAEAQRREWCSTYDDVIAEINASLFDEGEGSKLKIREFETQLQITVNAAVRGHGTIDNLRSALQTWLYRGLDNHTGIIEAAADNGVALANFEIIGEQRVEEIG